MPFDSSGKVSGISLSSPNSQEARQHASITPLPGALDGAVDRLALCDLRAGAPFEADGADGITFHCVLVGTILTEIDGEAAIVVPAGSALLLPGGHAIRISADSDAGQSRRTRRPDARAMIGRVSPRAAATLGLGAVAEPLVHDTSMVPGASAMIAALVDELDHPTIGTIPLASALMKLCLIYAARDMAQGVPLGSSRVGRAVTAVLTDPGAPHSIASLADLVRMSRATFIRHFSKLTGSNPMAFVAKARLDHAAELLRSTDLPIKTVASRIGFQNHSHFARAFRRANGVEPSMFRKSPAQGTETTVDLD
ncbi:MAG: AraC family transcriptional regulator [Sphingomonadales bacterium]|nr:MAG: AraC family transcriptional regulator [Sphingomonadales bacterium]